MNPTRIRIFYPADPLGVVPGGIDTFIRGLIKWAPDDLRFSLVGMTTDPVARPVGRFSSCTLGEREFDFFPAVGVNSAGQRGRLPLSLRYTAAVARRRAELARDFDVFEFHRVEPSLLFASDRRPKNAVFHLDPNVITESSRADILWKHAPRLYRAIESSAAGRLTSAWCVHQSGVATLKQRYPALADNVRFVPTWVDDRVFAPVPEAERLALRARWGERLGLAPDVTRIISVGRLDTAKDPELMLDAFARLVDQGRRVAWLVVGDGVLRPKLEQRVVALGLGAQVHFLGLRSPDQIAELLQAADLYALSSAYEGMPMALLEAMGCGLPAASTDVGEVRRVVQPGVNGSIAEARTAEAFAACMGEVIDRLASWRGAPAVAATAAFRPASVLDPVYRNYRELGELARRVPGHAVASSLMPLLPTRHPYPLRRRERVVGAPIDVLSRGQARRVVIDWARERESRYVCFCNVHSAVAFTQDRRHKRALENADLVTSDGAPIAWMLRRKGHVGQPRLDGPNMMWTLCRDAETRGIKVGLYGSTPETLRALRARMAVEFPKLRVSFCESPPFTPLTAEEDEAVCQEIDAAGVGLLFVGLGCPKQEHWMAEHVGRLRAVMLGVGAAFDFHAGLVSRAPVWVQSLGLEWTHRLLGEPRRLWRRYLTSNSLFILRGAGDLARRRARRPPVGTPRPRPAARPRVTARASRHRAGAPVNQQYIEELLARVDASILRHNGRLIEFVASGSGEGTSTLATAYAHVAATHLNRRVLLLDMQSTSDDRPGLLGTLATRRSAVAAIQPHAGGYATGSLFGAGESGWTLAGRHDLWKALRSSYDEIVLDMPSSAESHAGVMLAPHCDGVIVVLEAEKTRAPVVEALVANLRAVHANLLGTVLNKRQFHLPAALYKRL